MMLCSCLDSDVHLAQVGMCAHTLCHKSEDLLTVSTSDHTIPSK